MFVSALGVLNTFLPSHGKLVCEFEGINKSANLGISITVTSDPADRFYTQAVLPCVGVNSVQTHLSLWLLFPFLHVPESKTSALCASGCARMAHQKNETVNHKILGENSRETNHFSHNLASSEEAPIPGCWLLKCRKTGIVCITTWAVCPGRLRFIQIKGLSQPRSEVSNWTDAPKDSMQG